MSRYLTEQTYAELLRLISTQPGFGLGGVAGGACRHVAFVQVTDDTDAPLYLGTVIDVDATGSQTSFEVDGVWLREFQDRALTVGETYLSVQTGPTADGDPCFITVAPPTGCFPFVSSVSCDGDTLVVVTKWYKNGVIYSSDPGC